MSLMTLTPEAVCSRLSREQTEVEATGISSNEFIVSAFSPFWEDIIGLTGGWGVVFQCAKVYHIKGREIWEKGNQTDEVSPHRIRLKRRLRRPTTGSISRFKVSVGVHDRQREISLSEVPSRRFHKYSPQRHNSVCRVLWQDLEQIVLSFQLN